MARHLFYSHYVSLSLWLFLTNVLFLICGIYTRKWSSSTAAILSYPTSFMNTVAQEWNAPTLTSLVTTNNTYCPSSAPETVLTRNFMGSDLGCNCLGVFSEFIKT